MSGNGAQAAQTMRERLQATCPQAAAFLEKGGEIHLDRGVAPRRSFIAHMARVAGFSAAMTFIPFGGDHVEQGYAPPIETAAGQGEGGPSETSVHAYAQDLPDSGYVSQIEFPVQPDEDELQRRGAEGGEAAAIAVILNDEAPQPVWLTQEAEVRRLAVARNDEATRSAWMLREAVERPVSVALNGESPQSPWILREAREQPISVALNDEMHQPVWLDAESDPEVVTAAVEFEDREIGFGDYKVSLTTVIAIVDAADAVGIDPSYLMAVAERESSFNPLARARTSSAAGLFQFIEQTWLGMVQLYGAEHGLEEEAALVMRSGKRLNVADPVERKRILDLREDPYLSAAMAAEMTLADRRSVAARIGREVKTSENYLSHFLGPGRAAKLIAASSRSPNVSAAGLFPDAAKANRSLFYKGKGRSARAVTAAEFHGAMTSSVERRISRYEDLGDKVPEIGARQETEEVAVMSR